MFKIILFIYGNLASELIRALSLMLREQKDVEAYGLELGYDVDGLRGRIRISIVGPVDWGWEVLVLTDLMNGTPLSPIMQLKEECSFRHFTGANLPLLLKVLDRRMSQDLASIIVGLDKVTRRSIYDCNTFLSQIAL